MKAKRVLWAILRFPALVISSAVVRGLPVRGRPQLVVFGFSAWKTFIHDWFPDRNVIVAPAKVGRWAFHLYWKWIIRRDPRTEVISWQYKGPKNIKYYCEANRIHFKYVEDGFIRSVSLGALHTPPMSLAFDRRDMYFVAESRTDLEDILLTYDFDADRVLMDRARKAISHLLDTGISKYNSGRKVDIETIYGPKRTKRVLVIGQVERDASIAFGCSVRITNNDLVRMARAENPDAQIIYKPHPEVLSGIAPSGSDPDEVRCISQIIEDNVSLADSFRTIDHVYTITSLSGFEALLRGIKVTTVGCPFYSGWGLTDDRQRNERRDRILTLEQLFAGAYILYPKYFDPEHKRYVEIEDVLSILTLKREEAIIKAHHSRPEVPLTRPDV